MAAASQLKYNEPRWNIINGDPAQETPLFSLMPLFVGCPARTDDGERPAASMPALVSGLAKEASRIEHASFEDGALSPAAFWHFMRQHRDRAGAAAYGHLYIDRDSSRLVSIGSLLLGVDALSKQPFIGIRPRDTSFLNGGAVLPEFRANGLQRQLVTQRVDYAAAARKRAVFATVNPRNIPSQRSMREFVSVALLRSNRLAVVRDFAIDDAPVPGVLPAGIDPADTCGAIRKGADAIALRLTHGTAVSPAHNAAVEALFRNDYFGFGCQKTAEGNVAAFVHANALPTGAAAVLQERQEQVRHIASQAA